MGKAHTTVLVLLGAKWKAKIFGGVYRRCLDYQLNALNAAKLGKKRRRLPVEWTITLDLSVVPVFWKSYLPSFTEDR